MYCRNCGSKLSENDNFCVSCGARADGASAPAAEAEPAAANALPSDPPARAEAEPEVIAVPAPGSGAVIPDTPKELASAPEDGGTVAIKSKKRRIGILAGLGAAVIALAALVFMTGIVSDETIDIPDILVYQTDNSLHLLKNFSTDATSICLTDTAVAPNLDFYPYYTYIKPEYYPSSAVKFSDDWEWVYFLENYDTSTGSASRYRADITKLEADSEENEDFVEKIDPFDDSESKSLDTYLDYRYSDDKTRIVFINADHELCYQLLEDENSCTKIDSDVYSIYCANEETFLYVKRRENYEHDVYRTTIGGESEKLLSGDIDIIKFPPGSISADRFYYVETVYSRDVPLYAFVNDIYLERDQAVMWAGMGSYEENRREELRNQLRNETVLVPEKNLYLFVDGESNLICESIFTYPQIDSEHEIAFYTKLSQCYKQIDISAINNAEDLELLDEFSFSTLFYTIGTNEEQQIEAPWSLRSYCMPDLIPLDREILLYFGDDFNFEDSGELISYQIRNGTLCNRTVLADNCYIQHFSDWIDGDEMYYYLNFDSDSRQADLYRYSQGKDTKLVAKNVAVYKRIHLQSDGSVYYMNDTDNSKSLMLATNGESTRIAEGVDEFICTESNQCIYRVGGDLYLYNRDGNKHLAENVTRFWCIGMSNTI